ncbi:MAG: YhcH/YjgK/YiaL family protein [Armatimonadetes bacterium]|nr:YhcH/YjgK/YiaL family protein [Armatimonadota bacterium]
MLLDTLANADRYAALHPGFRRAFEWLNSTDLGSLEGPRIEVDGERIFAVVAAGPGRGQAGCKREAHNHYIDIQVAIRGTDLIGWSPRDACRSVTQPYDSAKDVELFADEPAAWVAVSPGCFAVYWPEDTHAPMGADPTIELFKVVVKVKVAW